MNCHRQEQPQGVHYNAAFTSRDLLAGVVAPRPPFSVVFTDWLSIMAALGVGSRPSPGLWDVGSRGLLPRSHRLATGGNTTRPCPREVGRGAAYARRCRPAERARLRSLFPAGRRCAGALQIWSGVTEAPVPPTGHRSRRWDTAFVSGPKITITLASHTPSKGYGDYSEFSERAKSIGATDYAELIDEGAVVMECRYKIARSADFSNLADSGSVLRPGWRIRTACAFGCPSIPSLRALRAPAVSAPRIEASQTLYMCQHSDDWMAGGSV